MKHGRGISDYRNSVIEYLKHVTRLTPKELMVLSVITSDKYNTGLNKQLLLEQAMLPEQS